MERPSSDTTLDLSDSHSGKPDINSINIEPSDQMSNACEKLAKSSTLLFRSFENLFARKD